MIVVDTSAMVAITFKEDGFEAYVEAMLLADRVMASP
ncbi:MAG: type II toxin-antitoxin system VapC family toxin, partial [Caulobacteraceae bacterium]|nr:type II toxin-antitoxin system VapC family toxin [Caulobacteraceae bacterium]